MRKFIFVLPVATALLASCGGASEEKKEGDKTEKTSGDPKLQKEVQTYLDGYNAEYQKLLYAANEAQWTLNTYMVKDDTTAAYNAGVADKAMAEYTGSAENIEMSKKYLAKEKDLTDLQVRQLKYILYMAGNTPAIAKDIVDKRIAAQNIQTKNLYEYEYKINGKKVSANAIDEMLREETDMNKRLAAWTSSKEVGKGLKDGLVNLVDLRNKSVQALGYSDFFNYQVSEYDMTSDELMTVCDDMIKDLWPLYRELHTWARYELAAKYKQEVPEMLPAHWLPNRWGQEWSSLIEVEGFDLDGALKNKTKEWIISEGEDFYKSLGFSALPKSFHEKSSLYPVAPDAGYSKNNHASAWHFDNDQDVRSLMSVEPNAEWWGTVLHELGHIYYFLTYSNKDVPIILRAGANRAYHEAFGTQIGLAAMQKAFLVGRGLIPDGVETDDMKILLKEALDYVVVIPWSAGVMTGFEHELYANNLSPDQYNAKWWELVKKYQGIVPPSERGEEFCDAATKTHINDDAAQYYDYAMSNLLLFQFHNYIAKNILKQDPHNTNYWGSKEVGKFLEKLMYPGASVDWREHLKKNLGEEMSAKGMVEYFAPLLDYLKEQNKGRVYTVPETM
jgi:peptidyl-dipeptidase A